MSTLPTLTSLTTATEDPPSHLPPPPSETETSSSSHWYRRKSVRFSLACFLVVVFIICLTFAIRSWTQYEDNRVKATWDKHNCNVIETFVKPNPQNTRYRIEANVTELFDDSEPVTAFYGPSADYKWTKEEAEKRKSRVKTGVTKCWVRRVNKQQVSVTEVVIKTSPVPLYVAWTMTILAGLFGVLVAILLSNAVQETVAVDLRMPTESKKVVLNREQVRFVCDQFRGSEAGWDCAVCLEAGEGGIRLPCGHRFHGWCIRTWLRRGKAACPLCNWDLMRLFGQDGEPLDDLDHLERGDVNGNGEEVPRTEEQETDRIEAVPVVVRSEGD